VAYCHAKLANLLFTRDCGCPIPIPLSGTKGGWLLELKGQDLPGG
jgi:hypothetical protein